MGSDSEKGTRFTAVMSSVVMTLKMNGIDMLQWRESWLRISVGKGRWPTCRHGCLGRWRRRDDRPD